MTGCSNVVHRERHNIGVARGWEKGGIEKYETNGWKKLKGSATK